MKRLSALAALAFVGYICHYDIKYGTIPSSTEAAPVIANAEKEKPTQTTTHFIEVRVKAGDTVLSIIEKALKGSIPVSINQLSKDFTSLNNGLSPHEIQVGKTYKFPTYK
ncbi:LysM domain-containing protein [Priestia flexa]|uniref:LysM domain-containing protein n=1 Tax=Priestia flexa TaxID=86664 RepID=UPI000C247AB3|nr:LysM domain-containing protein [Priestia flexa]MEC0664699.1 LysM domain-containing protein [Priestia flexa]MED3823416.1 LysM domain-containing protein [Priestia flexa]